VATGRDERGDKGEVRGYRTRRCMHGSNRRTDKDTEREREMERESAGYVAQVQPECKRTTTAKLNDYRSANFTSGYRFERSISGNPDIDSQH